MRFDDIAADQKLGLVGKFGRLDAQPAFMKSGSSPDIQPSTPGLHQASQAAGIAVLVVLDLWYDLLDDLIVCRQCLSVGALLAQGEATVRQV
jgi:hypothetical protein